MLSECTNLATPPGTTSLGSIWSNCKNAIFFSNKRALCHPTIG
jgi:hypothetical protein